MPAQIPSLLPVEDMLSGSFLTSGFTLDHSGGNDKARIFLAVLDGRATSRAEAAKQLSIRSSSVSELVAELLEWRLLSEGHGPRNGRGRPSLALVANPHRLIALVFQVVHQSLRLVGVNLAGQVVLQEQLEVPGHSDNGALRQVFQTLLQSMQARIPNTTDITGIGFSLPGLVDTSSARWIFSTRWPRMHHLPLADIFSEHGWPIHVSRAVDSELRARLAFHRDSVLLLHWGYGISIAFGTGGQLAAGGGGFGEIGHWHLPGQDAPCRCGSRGCLETTAALWALGPALLGEGFQAGEDEESLARQLQPLDLLALPCMRTALEHIVLTLNNVCRIFFPTRVIVTGPLVANARLWAAFYDRFLERNTFVDTLPPELTADRRSREFEIHGTARPLLEAGLERWLRN